MGSNNDRLRQVEQKLARLDERTTYILKRYEEIDRAMEKIDLLMLYWKLFGHIPEIAKKWGPLLAYLIAMLIAINITLK